MMAAAWAFPLLAIAQLAPTLAAGWLGNPHFDAGGASIFLARALYVIALGLYCVWLSARPAVGEAIRRSMALAVGAGILAVFLPRVASVPILWVLQLTILAGLIAWAVAAWRCVPSRSFLLVAIGAHAVGALTIYPMCQIGASPELLALPRAAYVCNVVLDQFWAAMVPAGAGFVAWAWLMTRRAVGA